MRVVTSGLVIMAAIAMAAPLSAQRERVNPANGKYEPIPDTFSSAWPQPDLNAPNPYSVTKSLAQRMNRRIETPTAVKPTRQTETQLSTGLVSLGGMSMYDPGDSPASQRSYPSWWPK